MTAEMPIDLGAVQGNIHCELKALDVIINPQESSVTSVQVPKKSNPPLKFSDLDDPGLRHCTSSMIGPL